MLPPIPDSITPVKVRISAARPPLLKFIIAYTAINPWINWLIYQEDNEDANISNFLAIQVIVWLLCYALWGRKNWARLTFVAIYSLSLITLFSLEAFTHKVHAALEAALSLAIAWWLCSPAMTQFCKGKKS